MESIPKFAIAVASLGDYREGVIRELKSRLGHSLCIYAGAPAYDSSIRLLNYPEVGVTPLKNTYIGPDILVQRIPLRRLISSDSVVMDLNPRVLHVWPLALLRRCLGKRTILWGHAWSRSGPGSRSDALRGLMRKLATGILAYTHAQASELRAKHPGKFVIAAPNSLYSRSQMKFDTDSRRFRILYVGRLVKSKKPSLLLEAFDQIAGSFPEAVLTIIGDGPERAALMERAKMSAFQSRIVFPGYISDFESLRPYYAEAIVSVSPGYVGLSITQSLAFGVPMLISKDENHSPEIEAALDGFNCSYFATDDPFDLSRCLTQFIKDADAWRERGPMIAADCRDRYSIEKMADGLELALTGAALCE